MVKTSFFLFILVLVNRYPSHALPRYCEIIYKDKEISKANDLINRINNNERKYCKKIGIQHDKLLNPMPSKPIYACCDQPENQ